MRSVVADCDGPSVYVEEVKIRLMGLMALALDNGVPRIEGNMGIQHFPVNGVYIIWYLHS